MPPARRTGSRAHTSAAGSVSLAMHGVASNQPRSLPHHRLQTVRRGADLRRHRTRTGAGQGNADHQSHLLPVLGAVEMLRGILDAAHCGIRHLRQTRADGDIGR
jgi:hypothetical protein